MRKSDASQQSLRPARGLFGNDVFPLSSLAGDNGENGENRTTVWSGRRESLFSFVMNLVY